MIEFSLYQTNENTMNMNTKKTLPFADTICGDVRKIINVIFKDCPQKDLDRLCLRSYDITNERFLIDDHKDSRRYEFVFVVGGRRFPDDVKFKLRIICEYLYAPALVDYAPNPVDEFEVLYELKCYKNSKLLEKLFDDVPSALAFCDGCSDGVIDDEFDFKTELRC